MDGLMQSTARLLRSRIITASLVVLAVSIGLVVAGWSRAPSGLSSSSAVPSNPASSFSNTSCSASGATSTKSFPPAGLSLSASADNTSAIQTAIDDASSAGGGTVALPAGTFLIDGHLVLKNNVRLVGKGTSTVLKAAPGFLNTTGPEGGYPLITTSDASNDTIANLTANQSGNTLDADAHQEQRLSAYLIDVRDSRNVVVDDVYTRNPFTYSIAVVGSSHFCITHSNTEVATSGLYYGLDGIHIQDSHTGQVIDNYINQRIGTDGDDGLVAQTLTAQVYDVLYADNTVRGGNDGDGMQLAVGNYPVYNLVIRDNDFWGSPYGIRTGYWDTGTNGAVHNIIVSGNYIHNLVPGKAFPDGGNAIYIGGFDPVAPVTLVTITDNRICKAGIIVPVKGARDSISGNISC
jgi:polygalacturonase